MLGSMSTVSVRIVDVPPAAGAGPLQCALAAARSDLARAHRRRFLAAHANDVQIIADARAAVRPGAVPGTIVLDSASLPFATAGDYERLVQAAAIGRPAPPTDDADELWRGRARLDSPLDLILAARDRRLPTAVAAKGRALLADPASARLRDALASATDVLRDRRRQVLFVAARPSMPAWPADAVRALTIWESEPRRTFDLDRPDLLAQALAPQADAAIVDTRVALATRLMRRRRTWPSIEDRFASDLLRPDAVEDPWLRDLTRAAAEAGLPILFGGPALVDWGIRLLLIGVRRDPVRGPA